jgi:hypothetical protein
VCDQGDQNLGGAGACAPDASRCYTKSLCKITIRCAGPPQAVCAGYPSCKAGYQQVAACPNDGTPCVTETMCGAAILCAQIPVMCEAYPSCDLGHWEVPSQSQCLQDDAVCYSRSLCGTTIWCTGPLATDAGAGPG